MKYSDNCIVFEQPEATLYEETRPFVPAYDHERAFQHFCFHLSSCVPANTPRIELADLGSGVGRLAIPLALQYARYAKKSPVPHLRIRCIDLSTEMLSLLDSKWEAIKDQCLPYVDLVCKPEDDVRKLGRNGPEFHAAIAHWIFHVIEDWRLAVYAIDQAVHPGGCLFLATERSSLYSAIDGDLRDLADGEDGIAHKFWAAFLAERCKFDRDSPRRRLGTLVIDDRIERLLSVLGWSNPQQVMSATWKTKRTIAWLIDKVVAPRSFTNMQLYVDSEKADAEFKQIADRLRDQFERRLEHEWTFETSFAINALTRKTPRKVEGEILVGVARATVGKRWERGIGRASAVGPIWDRLVRSTWIRLNRTSTGKLIPLGGTTSRDGKKILGAFISVPSTVDLDDQENSVASDATDPKFWAQAKVVWEDLTSALDMREPFAICLSPAETTRALRQWETASRVHPALHILPIDADALLHLSTITKRKPDKSTLEEHLHASAPLLGSRCCADLLFAASKIGLLPYDHDRVGAKFLAGLARLILADIPLTYVFPSAGTDRSRPVRGFLLGANEALDGESAKLFWSLGDILFSEYEQAMLIQDEELLVAQAPPPLSAPVSGAVSLPQPAPTKEALRAEAITLLSGLKELYLSNHQVVGNYVRFDTRTVTTLNGIAQRILGACTKPTRSKENHVLWGYPGQGKTYLVKEIARETGVHFTEIDLKKDELTPALLSQKLSEAKAGPDAHLCLVDEIDARSADKWPYEIIFDFLELNETKPEGHGNKIFVLIGSKPPDINALEQEIKSRHKGRDLWRRISYTGTIPPLILADQLVVALSQMKRLASEASKKLQAVDRLALLYILTEVGPTAGQITDFLKPAIERLPSTDFRLKFTDLFGREDDEKRDFFRDKERNTLPTSDPFLYIRD